MKHSLFALLLFCCLTPVLSWGKTLKCTLPERAGREVHLYLEVSEAQPRVGWSEVAAGGLELPGISSFHKLCEKHYSTNVAHSYPFPKVSLQDLKVFEFACANGDFFVGEIDLQNMGGTLWSPHQEFQLSNEVKYPHSFQFPCEWIDDAIWSAPFASQKNSCEQSLSR